MALFQVENLSKKYQGEVILDHISFALPNIGLFAIKGESGSGKSTLLKCLMGLEKPDDGKIYFQNKEIKNFAKFRNRYASFIYQNYNLISFLTGKENLKLSCSLKNKKLNKFTYLLEQLNIKKQMNQNSASLSGGEKQRFAIVRSILSDAKIIFCDEPTGSLDEENGILIMELLKDLSKDCLVIMVSHNLTYIEKYALGILELKNHHLQIVKMEYSSKQDYINGKVSSLHFYDKLNLATKTISKNISKVVLSIISLAISLTFSLLLINGGISLNNQINERMTCFMDYNILKITKEEKIKLENSTFSLVKEERLDRYEIEELKYLIPLDEYHYDLSCILSSYPIINYPILSDTYLSNIEFVPYSYLMEEKMDKYLEGKFPSSSTQVIINQEAYKYIQDRFKIKVNKQIDTRISTQEIITDFLDFELDFEIVGVVEEFSLISTPKIYYPLDMFKELAQSITLPILSSYYKTSMNMYDRLTSLNLEQDGLTSAYLIVEIEDISQVNSIYKRINSLAKDDYQYVIKSNALDSIATFTTLYNSIKDVVTIFIAITLIISGLLLVLLVYSLLNDYKKDIGILLSMGIKKSDLFDIFFFQGLIVSLIGYVLSIVLYLLSNKFISSKLNELIAIELLPNIPYIKTLLINLILIIVISLISSFISLFSITKLKICDILKED